MRDNFKDKGEPVIIFLHFSPDMEAWGLPSTHAPIRSVLVGTNIWRCRIYET